MSGFLDFQGTSNIDNIVKDVILDLHNQADDAFQDGDVFTAIDISSFINVLEVSLTIATGKTEED